MNNAIELYLSDPTPENWVKQEPTIQKLVHFFGLDLRRLIGLHLLDLGCGSNQSPDGFSPIAAEEMHEFGIVVTGIDYAPNTTEPFPNYQVNLHDSSALDFLPNESFDIVHHNALTYQGGGVPSPARCQMPFYIDEEIFVSQLLLSAQRLLRPGGIYLQEWTAWQKQNDDALIRLEILACRKLFNAV